MLLQAHFILYIPHFIVVGNAESRKVDINQFEGTRETL